METVELLAIGIVLVLMAIRLSEIKTTQEKLMAQGQTGLQNLQALQQQFEAFAAQEDTDIQALTSSVNAAIALLSSSEDPQVQLAVTALQATLTKMQAQDAALQTMTSNLNAAENPQPPAQDGASANSAARRVNAPPPPASGS